MNSKTKLYLLAGFFLLALLFFYKNHFDNGFYFDDAHTIVSNEFIRDLKNLPEFFTNAETFSSLPANRAYRPMVTTINATSYAMGGGLKQIYFHAQMFFWYVVQLFLMFFLFRNIFNLAKKHRWNNYFALFATAYYGLHTCNAETINYLISISDSFSTLCIVAALLLYQIKFTRKKFLYLLPMILGIYTKQTGAMFAPILFLYILFFEEKVSLQDLFTLKNFKGIINTFIKVLPAVVICGVLLVFNQLLFTPETTVSSDTAVSKWAYFTTQFYIVTYYLGNFILPINLSADPDFVVLEDVFDYRIVFGFFVIVLMLLTAFFTSRKAKTRPIAFGILFFFIALLPTSSFVPLYQIANDHRTFFPFVGLVLAVSWAISLFLIQNEKEIKQNILAKTLIPSFFILVILAYGFGVYQRTEVWGSAKTLWEDVTVKSPLNGRGWMNYGNCLMGEADYDGAEICFNKAIKFIPYYSYLHVNFGVLKEAQGKNTEVEQYYQNALRYDATNPAVYYYYGDWLNRQSRMQEAKTMLENGLKISPNHSGIKRMLTQMENIDMSNPNLETLINQSLSYYRSRQYEKCIEACLKAIAIDSTSSTAYNNLCCAYNQLKQWEKGAEACRKSLEIEDSALARNNLKWAEDNL